MTEKDPSALPTPGKGRVEVRVIGGSTPEDVGELPFEPYDPEVEGEWELEGPVRLESSELPEIRRSTADAAAETTGAEEPRPAPARDRRIPALTFWMAVLVGIVAIWVVLKVINDRPKSPVRASEAPAPKPEAIATGADSDRMSARASELPLMVGDLIDRYVAASTVEEAKPLVRSDQREDPRLAESWEPLALAPEGVVPLDIRLHVEDERSWVTANGENDRFERIHLVFHPEGEELLLDWKASFGIGDVPFTELRSPEFADDRVVTMRVVAELADFYNSVFPESEWRSFRLCDRSDDLYVWGFVPRGSELEERMSRALQRDSNFLRELSRRQLRLGLRSESEGGSGQFEIVEFLGEGWIEP